MVLLHHTEEETKGKQSLVLRTCQVGWREAWTVGGSLGSIQLDGSQAGSKHSSETRPLVHILSQAHVKSHISWEISMLAHIKCTSLLTMDTNLCKLSLNGVKNRLQLVIHLFPLN